jgi:hypothetical protein
MLDIHQDGKVPGWKNMIGLIFLRDHHIQPTISIVIGLVLWV